MVWTNKEGKQFSAPDGGSARSIYGDSETGVKKPVASPLDTTHPLSGKSQLSYTKQHRFAVGNTLGGRRPRSLEWRAREFILKCIEGEKGFTMVVKKVFSQALKGNFRAQELLFAYILGKPTDRVHVETSMSAQEISSPPIVRIIADHLRLEKLEKDAASAPTVVEAERVEEMERILNNAVASAPEVPVVEEVRAPKQRSNGMPTRKRTIKKVTPKKRKK